MGEANKAGMSAPASSGKPRPGRSADAIGRDIKAERAALEKSFGELRQGVSDTVEDVRGRAERIGRRALVVGPVVGAVVGGLAVAVAVLSRRRRRDDE
jgi:hypothetical protein